MKPKKFLAVVTAATMIAANSIGLMPDKFVNLPVFTSNAADIVASGECGVDGDNVVWQLDSEGTLTISGTGEMDSWALNSPWSEHSAEIIKVMIENGVTAIGEQAFADCTALTSATISDSVTSIGDYAFYSCDSLTTITIPDSVTSIGDKAFQYCENLTSINVDSENKNYVSEDGVLFNEDKSMLIHYPAGKTAEEYIIPDGVTSIVDEAFSGCNSLTTITIPDSVTSIGDKAFSDFTGLTTITIPDSVTSIGDEAFSDCISLTTITIPDRVTSIGDSVFCYCVSLTSITIPDSVTSIGSNAFTNCGSLATITINNPECTIYDSEITISDTAEIRGYANSTAQAYAEKYSRKFVALEEKPAAEIVASGDCGAEGDNVKWQLDSEGTLTISGEGEMNNYDFEEDAPWNRGLHGNEAITKVIIDSGVTYIGDKAFSNCIKLSSVTIPDSVTSIGYCAFGYNPSLKSIVIPPSVTSIDDAVFCLCESLMSITIPESLTSIGEFVFHGTPWLEAKRAENPLVSINNILIDGLACEGEITIPSNISYIFDSAFCQSEKLTAINVDKDNKYYSSENGVLFNKDKTAIEAYPIGNTAKEYTIPDSVVSIENQAFIRCENLTSITIPKGVKSIGEYAFYECDGFSSIEISDTVENICDYAFTNCSSLTSITIPDSVTSIGHCAFWKCNNLTSITIKNPNCTIYESDTTISNEYDEKKKENVFNGTIHGYENSTAQAYAEKYNRKFVALDEKPTAVELGDVNNDGSVDSSDASLVLAEYAKIQTGGAGEFTETQRTAADVNNDDVVDSSDASKILAYYAMVSTGKEPTWD